MKGNKRKQWGIQYLGQWCTLANWKIELHWCKADAEKSIEIFWNGYSKVGYKAAKYVERA